MDKIRQNILREQELQKAKLAAHFGQSFSPNGTVNEDGRDVETIAAKSADEVHKETKRQSIIKAVEIDGIGDALDILKSAGDEDIFEKAKHQDGDMHPNGKWVWVASAAGGKGDWRTHGGRTHKKSAGSNDATKKTSVKKKKDDYVSPKLKSGKPASSLTDNQLEFRINSNNKNFQADKDALRTEARHRADTYIDEAYKYFQDHEEEIVKTMEDYATEFATEILQQKTKDSAMRRVYQRKFPDRYKAKHETEVKIEELKKPLKVALWEFSSEDKSKLHYELFKLYSTNSDGTLSSDSKKKYTIKPKS